MAVLAHLVQDVGPHRLFRCLVQIGPLVEQALLMMLSLVGFGAGIPPAYPTSAATASAGRIRRTPGSSRVVVRRDRGNLDSFLHPRCLSLAPMLLLQSSPTVSLAFDRLLY